MDYEEIKKLDPGAYRVFWKTGGSVIAVVGEMGAFPERWISCSHWKTMNEGFLGAGSAWPDIWGNIKSMAPLDSDDSAFEEGVRQGVQGCADIVKGFEGRAINEEIRRYAETIWKKLLGWRPVQAKPVPEKNAPYGYCPKCGAPGMDRERRPNGNDTCYAGHQYPNKDAISLQQAQALAHKLANPEKPIDYRTEIDSEVLDNLKDWRDHLTAKRHPITLTLNRVIAFLEG